MARPLAVCGTQIHEGLCVSAGKRIAVAIPGILGPVGAAWAEELADSAQQVSPPQPSGVEYWKHRPYDFGRIFIEIRPQHPTPDR